MVGVVKIPSGVAVLATDTWSAIGGRDVVTVAYNLLYGAAVVLRINSLRSQGFPVPMEALRVLPRERGDLERRLGL